MATDGRRKKLLDGVITTLRSATGNDYFVSYTGTKVVTQLRENVPSRLEATQNVAIRVWDGAERHVSRGADANVTATLDIIVEVTIRNAPSQTMVQRMADVLADINLVIGRNPSAGGDCTFIGLESVEAPTYDFAGEMATAVVHVRGQYDYEPGVDR